MNTALRIALAVAMLAVMLSTAELARIAAQAQNMEQTPR
jgi:hypothetical protein